MIDCGRLFVITRSRVASAETGKRRHGHFGYCVRRGMEVPHEPTKRAEERQGVEEGEVEEGKDGQ